MNILDNKIDEASNAFQKLKPKTPNNNNFKKQLLKSLLDEHKLEKRSLWSGFHYQYYALGLGVIVFVTLALISSIIISQKSYIPQILDKETLIEPLVSNEPHEQPAVPFWKTYVNQKYNFSFEYPPTWTVVENPNSNPGDLSSTIVTIYNGTNEYNNDDAIEFCSDCGGFGTSPYDTEITIIVDGKKATKLASVVIDVKGFGKKGYVNNIRLSRGGGHKEKMWVGRDKELNEVFDRVLASYKTIK